MAMQKPLVSTSIGCEGIEVTKDKNIIIANNPDEFANSIVSLLKNDKLCKKLGKNGRKLVEEKYSWKTISEKLEFNYENLRKKR